MKSAYQRRREAVLRPETPLDVYEDELLASIVAEELYHEFPGRVVCCLVLESGFSVVGVGGPRREALAAARAKLWEMDAYMTAEALSNEDG